jgi:hypothetical protein
MFIQTQQTSSVNSSTSSSSSGSGNNTAHHHSKKRKLEYDIGQSVIQHALVQSTSDYQLDNPALQRYSVSGNNTAFSTLQNNGLQKQSPNQQTLVRASTIKLLDTYQRCGQKVSNVRPQSTLHQSPDILIFPLLLFNLPSSFAIFVHHLRSPSSFTIFVHHLRSPSSFTIFVHHLR